jgi:hypothetical protein
VPRPSTAADLLEELRQFGQLRVDRDDFVDVHACPRESSTRLEAQVRRPTADVEQLIPRLAEEIQLAMETLPKTLAAGNVDLARQELKGYLGSIRVVAEPTRMLLYSERGFVEAAVMRAGGTMEGIVGSGGAISLPSTLPPAPAASGVSSGALPPADI